MANTNAPFGFSQYSGTGSSPTYEQVQLAISSTNSTSPQIFSGDPVAQLSTGYICQVGTNGTTSANAAATGSMIGIFAGCKYLSVSQKRTVWSNYWPGSDVASGNYVTGYIVNDPNARFIAQSDSTGIAFPTDINATIGFAIGTGNAANGISGAYLDTTTINTATYNVNAPFKIVGVYQPFVSSFPGSYANGQAYDWAIVSLNNVATRNFTGV